MNPVVESIIDNLKEVVFQTDAQGMWTFLNRAWEEITGFSVSETLGVLFLNYVHPDDRQLNQQRFQPLIERKKEYCRHEVRYLTKDGGFRWIEVHARLTLDDAGQIIGTSGTLSDVTERRLATDQLREARQRLEFVLASNPAIIYAGRPGKGSTPWETTFISDNAREIVGYPPSMFLEDPGFWMSTIHPDDLPAVRQSLAAVALQGRTSHRFRTRCADGSYRWMRNDTRILADAAGQPVETFGCLVDETHTHTIEESLRSHAAILEAVGIAAQRFLDAASWRNEIGDVLGRLGVAAHVTRVSVSPNDHTDERHEWTSEPVPCPPYQSSREFERWSEVLGRGEPVYGNVSDFPAAERAVLAPQQVRSLLLVPIFTGRDWWGTIGFDDCAAERQWSTAEIEALKAAAGILGAAINRERTESALRYSEALLRTMNDASPLGFYIVDNRSDQILYCNDRFCEIWGIQHLAEALRRGELRNKDIIPFCATLIDDVATFAASCEPLQEEGNRCVVTDCIDFHDGRKIRRFSTQVRDAVDTYFGRLYVFEDVTEQKRIETALLSSHSQLEARVAQRTADLEQLNRRLHDEVIDRRTAQQALADREAHFRTLIENASDVIFVVNANAVIEYVSPTVIRVLGYRPTELIGRSGAEFIDSGDKARTMAQFRAGLSVPGSHSPFEFQVRHKNGSSVLFEGIGNNQMANPSVHGIVITIRDVTDRRRLEDQFRQAQKMEAVGRLAGGVAHDFNNFLTVICGYSELMAKRIPADNPLLRNVTQIQRAGARATDLVQQLLAFSRKQVVQPTVLDLNDAVADLEKMLRRLIGEDVELSIAVAPKPLWVRIDRTQLDQILMNLSVNARDAMPGGGTLSIRTRVHSPRGTPNCGDCKVGSRDFAVIEVRDNGCGMSEETRAHIFEPFFTTKEVGKGTGLGLSMVYGAVQQAGGHVCLDTEPGRGAEFRICLPRVSKSVPVQDEMELPASSGGQETVLVVEDEELVRTMLSDAVREAGYHVLEACHGEHALAVARQSDAEVDLLVTDVVMPRMGGPELAARLSPIQPAMKVLYVSGYPRQELDPGCHFLKKPFTPDRLIAEVRAILDQPVAAIV